LLEVQAKGQYTQARLCWSHSIRRHRSAYVRKPNCRNHLDHSRSPRSFNRDCCRMLIWPTTRTVPTSPHQHEKGENVSTTLTRSGQPYSQADTCFLPSCRRQAHRQSSRCAVLTTVISNRSLLTPFCLHRFHLSCMRLATRRERSCTACFDRPRPCARYRAIARSDVIICVCIDCCLRRQRLGSFHASPESVLVSILPTWSCSDVLRTTRRSQQFDPVAAAQSVLCAIFAIQRNVLQRSTLVLVAVRRRGGSTGCRCRGPLPVPRDFCVSDALPAAGLCHHDCRQRNQRQRAPGQRWPQRRRAALRGHHAALQ